MKINRKNYELYFVDYLDNNLSRGDMLEFMAFLAENPDLEEELNLVKEIKLEPETISYSAKNSLKKINEEVKITKEQFEELCIGNIENTLSKEEIILFETQIKLHPELEKEFKLFELSILKPNLTIEFSAKDSLKHLELTNEQINHLCINKIENNLSVVEEQQFNKLHVNSAEFKKEFELFNKTILISDTSIVFPNKSSLKRRTLTNTRIIFTRIVPAAAAVALLVMIAFNSGFLGKQTHSGKMFTNSQKPNNLILPKKQEIIIENSTNKNFAIINKKQIKTNNTIQTIQSPDTTNSIAQNNPIVITDTTQSKQNVIEKSNLNNTTNNYTASNNPSKEDLNKPMEAVFANSKYSHFRDMIDNVPYASITSKNSGLASIGVWDVVEAGSKGLEYITGTPVSVENKTDKKNHTKHFSFNIGRIGFSRTVHK
jgi:hypothetical protein